ncbi:MAG: Crp/Fnr family transcriptional regulator [Bacteroidaceae bacterium]
MEIEELLNTPLFKDVKEETLRNFLATTPNALRSYRSNQFIALQGNPCQSLFILCKGTVRTHMTNAEGKQLTIETIEAPRALAPAFIFATENRFPVNIETLTLCEVLVINKSNFLELMHEESSIMQNFLRIISDRSIFLSKKVNSFALQNLKERLLNYLHIHGDIKNQQEVANILGVARPSLARALSELANEGLLRGTKRSTDNS